MNSGTRAGGKSARDGYTIAVSVVLTAAAVYALWQVWALRWVTDDAFISFRYALNLNRGLGLVFNAGERVEGYTNFLWTVITAGVMRLGVDPVNWTALLGALAYFGTAATWFALSWKLHRRDPSRPFLPLAALCLLLQHDQHVFATGGLETSWVTCFITLGFSVLLLARRPRHFTLAGGLLTVAALSRPDALVFVGSAVCFALLVPGPRIQNAACVVWLPVLVYVPYWLWRYDYYGFPFPNTYYAKSASLAYYEQGIRYLWLYVKSYYVLALVPLAVLGIFLGAMRVTRAGTNRTDTRALALVVAFLLPYILYVVRVGGDFMFARFLIPVTGIAFFALESASRISAVQRRWLYAWMAILAAGVLARHDIYAKSLMVDGVAHEPACYPAAWHEQARSGGEALRPHFYGKGVRVAFAGRYAMWAYYSDPIVAIEAETGLTDTTVAHLPLLSRGRPGHEKPAPLEYLQKRHIHFLFRPPIPGSHPFDTLRVVRFGDLEALMVTYDRRLLESLSGESGIRFVNFPRYLDAVLAGPPRSQENLMELVTFSKSYYFNYNNDPVRLRALQDLAAQSAP